MVIVGTIAAFVIRPVGISVGVSAVFPVPSIAIERSDRRNVVIQTHLSMRGIISWPQHNTPSLKVRVRTDLPWTAAHLSGGRFIVEAAVREIVDLVVGPPLLPPKSLIRIQTNLRCRLSSEYQTSRNQQ